MVRPSYMGELKLPPVSRDPTSTAAPSYNNFQTLASLQNIPPGAVAVPRLGDQANDLQDSNWFVRQLQGAKAAIHGAVSWFENTFVNNDVVAVAAVADGASVKTQIANDSTVRDQQLYRQALDNQALAHGQVAQANTLEEEQAVLKKEKDAEKQAQLRHADANKDKKDEDNNDSLLALGLLGAGGASDTAVGMNGYQNGSYNNNNTRLSKVARRAAQMEKWEKMSVEGNVLSRGYAKARLGIAHAQGAVAGKIGKVLGPVTEKIMAPFGKLSESVKALIKPAAMMGEDASKIAKVTKMAKFMKPILKVGRMVAWAGAAVGLGVAAVAAAPVVATIGAVVGVVATVGMVAGAGLSAYSTYRATGSLKEASISGADFVVPVRAVRDLMNGSGVRQAAADGAESVLGFGGGTAGKLAQRAVNVVRGVQMAQTGVGVVRLGVSATEHPELVGMGLDIASKLGRGAIGDAADVAGQAVMAPRDDRVSAAASAAFKNENIRHIATPIVLSSLHPKTFGAVSSPANDSPPHPVPGLVRVRGYQPGL